MRQESQEKFTKALIKALKGVRKEQNLSHERLAQMSGISRQAIGKIEAGERTPTIFTIYKLSTALGLSLDEFVKLMELD